MKIPTENIELWLLSWRESHNGGFTVTFAVEPDKIEYFKRATARKGKHAGQRYQTVFVQLNDQDEPDPQSVAQPAAAEPARHKAHFPGGLCGLAVRWCADEHFQQWLALGPLADDWNAVDPSGDDNESAAKAAVLHHCLVNSRKELDTDAAAAATFKSDILDPYSKVRKEEGLDDGSERA